MLLLLICLFLNYDLFSCERARKPRPNESQLPVQMGDKPKQETETFLRELREEIRQAESQRRAMDLGFNFGFGFDDYDITPMQIFTTTKSHHTEQRNIIRAKPKERNFAQENNEDFLDYDITHMFWTGTPKIHETEQNTPPEFFLPTPVEFQVTTEHVTTRSPTPNPWQNFGNFPRIETTLAPGFSDPPDPVHLPKYPAQPIEGAETRIPPSEPPNLSNIPHDLEQNASPFSLPPFSVPPVSTLTPLSHPVAQTTFVQTYEPGSPSFWTGPLSSGITFPHGVPTLYPRPSMETYIPSTTTASTSSSTTTELTSPSTVSTLSSAPTISIPRYQGITAGHEATSKSKDRETWMKLRSGRDKALFNLLRIDVSRNTPIGKEPPEPGRTLSKAECWVHNKQWTKGSADGRTKIGLRDTGVDLRTKPDTVDKASTQTVVTHELMAENDYELLKVSLPSTQPEREDVTITPTTAGDVLENTHTLIASPTIAGPNKKYYDMMKKLNEGYLVIFLLELTRLATEKRDEHVSEVLFPLEFIINGYVQNGSLSWLGETLTAKAKWLGKLLQDDGPYMENLIIMKMAHAMLRERRNMIAEDVNYLIDEANSFYNDDERELLLDALREFEMFPNVKYNGHQLCQKLIDAFFSPFRRTHLTARGKKLKRLTEEAIAKRFGRRMFIQDLWKLTGPETARSNHSSKNKYKPSFKERMELKRRRKVLMRRMFGNEGVLVPKQTNRLLEYPRLRTHKRFKVITQRQRAVNDSTNSNKERPTRNVHVRRLGKAIHPYNEMMQFFPQIPKEYLKHML